MLFRARASGRTSTRTSANADACVEGVLAIDPQNLQAIKTLERLRKAQGRWEELIGVARAAHCSWPRRPQEQAELCVEMGNVFHQQLKQVDRAVNSLPPRAASSTRAAARRCTRWARCTSAAATGPSRWRCCSARRRWPGRRAEAVELYHRMGKINEDMLMDTGSAKRCYQQALRDRPGLPALHPRAQGHPREEKDWGGYEQALLQEAQQTEEPRGQGARAARGRPRYYAETKEDRDDGHALLRGGPQARARTPWRRRARWRTSTSRARTGQRGERMLDIVVAQDGGDAPWPRQDGALAAELCRQLYRLGYVAEKLGKQRQGARRATRRPTSSTPPTCRRWRAAATCWCRPSATRTRSRSTRPSSSTTATTSPTSRWWRSTGSSATSTPQLEPVRPRAEPLREGAGHRPRPRAVAARAGGADGRRPASGTRPPSYRQQLRQGARRRRQVRGLPGAGPARAREAEGPVHGHRRVPAARSSCSRTRSR